MDTDALSGWLRRGVDDTVVGQGTLPGSQTARVVDSARYRPRNDHCWFCEHRHDVNAYVHAPRCAGEGGQSLC